MTVEANDGEKAINQMRIPMTSFTGTYKAGTSASKIMRDLITASGMSLKPFDWSSLTDRFYQTGFAFVGSGKVLMNNLANYLGLEWSVQNNEIQLVQTGLTDGSTIVSLTPETGLIGSPKRLNDVLLAVYGRGKGKTQKEVTALGQKRKKRLSGGYEIKCLLQAAAEPGGIVQVTSEDLNGQEFRIVEVEHVGDTHGSDWTSTLTTIAL